MSKRCASTKTMDFEAISNYVTQLSGREIISKRRTTWSYAEPTVQTWLLLSNAELATSILCYDWTAVDLAIVSTTFDASPFKEVWKSF